MPDLDVTVDGNLTNNTTPAATDRFIHVDNGTGDLQDMAFSVFNAYTAALTETLTNKTLTAPVINTPTVTDMTLDGERFSIGTSPHASPTDNDLFYETDTGILWTYGTYAAASRWVSVQKYPYTIESIAAVASAARINLVGGPIASVGYNIYLDAMFFKHDVLTTNNGSNYWTLALRKVSGTTAPATGAGTSLGSCNTSTSTAGTWAETSASINAVIDGTGAGMELIFSDLTIGAGAPGNIWYVGGVSYRLVRP